MGDRLNRLRRLFESIRTRMLVGFVALLVFGLVAAILLTRYVELTDADREIEVEQAQEVEELRCFAMGGCQQPGGDSITDVETLFRAFLATNVPTDEEGHYTISDAGYFYGTGSPDLFADPQFAELWDVTEPTRSTTTTDVDGIGEVRSLAVPVRVNGEVEGVFVVASFPADDYGEVDQLVTVIGLSGIVVIVLTSALAWSLSGRVLRPVRDLTETARQINETDLTARIPVEGHDELAELSTTFNEMVARLEQGFDAQRRFLDDVAHELRTPITIVSGHLEMLGDDPAERAETVEIVTDELDRMSRYVGDLLVLAKAEQPDFLILRPVDLGELAADVLSRVSALGNREWVIDEAPAVGHVAVLADDERLTEALINLADNAVGHTGDGDELGLGVSHHGGEVRLWVRDTGSGVDPTIADTLFDRHTRGVSSRTQRSKGVGIGLSIVEAIARAHGGRIAVDNRPGHGATFVIVFPARTNLPPPPTGATHPPEGDESS